MEVGCLIGGQSNVYPNETSSYFNNTNVKYYYSTQPIHVRYSTNDPVCGLPQNVLQDQVRQCIVGSQWGTEVRYQSKQIYCSTVNVPLDRHDLIMFMLLIVMIYSVIKMGRVKCSTKF